MSNFVVSSLFYKKVIQKLRNYNFLLDNEKVMSDHEYPTSVVTKLIITKFSENQQMSLFSLLFTGSSTARMPQRIHLPVIFLLVFYTLVHYVLFCSIAFSTW